MEEENKNIAEWLDDCQASAIEKCVTTGKYAAAGLMAVAWGFLFEENQPYMRSLLIIVILLSLVYFVWELWRSYKIALKTRNLWEKLNLGIYNAQQVQNIQNDLSKWSFTIFKMQLIVLVIILLSFITYCVAKLLMQ